MKHGLLIQVAFRSHQLTEEAAHASYIVYPKTDKSIDTASTSSEVFDFLLDSIRQEGVFLYPITSQTSRQLIYIQDEELLKSGLIHECEDWICCRA